MLIETDISRRRYQQIADRLADHIRTADMAAGDRLPSERDLASSFDVSRQTVREALIALEVAGVVEIRLGSGIYVKAPGATAATIVYEDAPGPLEILEARRTIERETAALAAQRISNEELQQLQVLLRLMEQSAAQQQTEEAEAHDGRFHIAVAKASRNSALASTVNWLWALRVKSDISRYFHQKVRARGSQPDIDDHLRVFEALARHNREAARDAMHDHIERVYQEFSEFSLE
ncbi:FadR family transcriptional regulator [Exilibacterium tricleocarpae]|uniref:FadR family transcriptional regulator n=1 Tax=Exilibacterium tricleocarpae TaxID=2591008 RepID=A0A545U6K6_9GAMM|nr:FadR/GntR family transcriptional regulator [Exilibacterium tricleocarpae]TQV85110.1 FadR family transcriptional regulator [Exilibacterium tricleocarpae]